MVRACFITEQSGLNAFKSARPGCVSCMYCTALIMHTRGGAPRCRIEQNMPTPLPTSWSSQFTRCTVHIPCEQPHNQQLTMVKQVGKTGPR